MPQFSKNQRILLSCLLGILITCSYLLNVNRSSTSILTPVQILDETENYVVVEDFSSGSSTSGSSGSSGTSDNNSSQSFKEPLPTNKTVDIGKPKTILFWGRFYRDDLSNRCVKDPTDMDFCPKSCIYTTDSKLLNGSDAVVVHGRERQTVPYPPERTLDQRWVFFMLESPSNSRDTVILNLKSKWNQLNVFNWTMTYRADSDVHIPYGYVKEKESSNITAFTESANKTKFGAWAVTNCNQSTTSNRNKLMENLQKHLAPISIDIYGHCSRNHSCPGGDPNDDPCYSPELCYAHVGPQYKFYFSLENSICREYVTEKFFYALKYGMVPVVLGPERAVYERLAPPHSFIHAEDFSSIADLGDYLLFLHEHPRVYQKYLDWRKKFEIDKTLYFRNAWCRLCQKLYEVEEVGTKSYPSIVDWWFGEEKKIEMGGRIVKDTGCKSVVFDLDGGYAIK